MAPELERFLDAQASAYLRVCAELRAGRKTSHWIWFIFPQMRGLGRSATAEFYGIESLEQARAYAAHPVLGARLRECCRLLLQSVGGDANTILGYPDDLKLKSSMTLFAHAAPDEGAFRQVLENFFGGAEDAATLKLIS